MTKLDVPMANGTLHLRISPHRTEGQLAAGGLRIAPEATSETATRLAELMHLKLAVARVPVAGGKAVVVPRPGAPRGALLQEIGEALAPWLEGGFLLGEDLGVAAADVVRVYAAAGVDPVDVVRRWHEARGGLELPEGLGLADLMNDEFAGVLAGTGAVDALAAATDLGPDLRASVQGLGTVGLAAARALVRHGVRVTAMTDAAGMMVDPDGLDVERVAGAIGPGGLADRTMLPDVATGPRDAWLEQPVDILVPAAVADAIRRDDLPRISERVRFVVEGANDPVDEETERMLEQRGVLVLPDFIANAGSAVAFGMLASGQTTVDRVEADYRERIRGTVRRCLAGPGTLRETALAEAAGFGLEATR